MDTHAHVKKSLECSLCLEFFHEPIQTPCGHTFCKECLYGWFHTNQSYVTSRPCPVCRRDVSFQVVANTPISYAIINIMESLGFVNSTTTPFVPITCTNCKVLMVEKHQCDPKPLENMSTQPVFYPPSHRYTQQDSHTASSMLWRLWNIDIHRIDPFNLKPEWINLRNKGLSIDFGKLWETNTLQWALTMTVSFPIPLHLHGIGSRVDAFYLCDSFSFRRPHYYVKLHNHAAIVCTSTGDIFRYLAETVCVDRANPYRALMRFAEEAPDDRVRIMQTVQGQTLHHPLSFFNVRLNQHL